MSASANHLDEIYEQLREDFASHPLISIRPTKGNPPDQYEIYYTLVGICKTGKGQIVESRDHTVEISIPFGFPHFPPSCKPKSDLFHPDFDSAAICLGDFWGQDSSLSDLIIHLGKMINGETYTTTNAFNEEAAEWYQENSAKFPLSHIDWEIATTAESSDNDHKHKIDTLEDEDLTTQFDFLTLEKETEDEDISLNTSFPDIDSSTVVDFELLHQLESQKKYYTLLKFCKSNTFPSEPLTNLCNKAQQEIRKVEKLHSDGKKFENKGDAQIALEKYQQITTIVSDFPTIDSDIQRVKQTLTLLGSISSNKTSDAAQPEVSKKTEHPADNKKSDTSQKEGKRASRRPRADSSQPAHDLFFPEKRTRTKLPLYLFLGIVVIILGGGGYLWYSFTEKLGDAEKTFAECSTAYANDQFDAAKRSCDKALQLVGEVKFIHQDSAHQLENSILEILHSEKLTQGLAGNILLNDKYMSKDEAKALLALKQKIKEAEKLFTEEKWQPALQLYKTFIAEAEKNSHLNPSIIDTIKRNILFAEFRMSYDPALVLIQNKQWEAALEKLLQAQKVLVSLPEAERGQYSEKVQTALQKCQFANLKEQGDLSFTESDWLSAIDTYNLALASGKETSLSPDSIETIRNNIKRAELYNSINKGNKAYASGAWDEAIAAYSKATGFLMDIQTTPSQTESDINVQKLNRIILQASIIRDRQTIRTLLENEDFKKARQIYQQILKTIAASPFSTESEFIDTTEEIKAAMRALDEQLALMKKIEYLKINYQPLFTANYPAAVPENLSNPVISKTKETDSKIVFRMQCTETSGGRSLSLVMFYAFNKSTGKWSLYSDN